MPRSLKVILGLSALVALLLALAVGARARYQHFTIPSHSMAPTVGTGDLALVDRWAYGYALSHSSVRLSRGRAPERGEVALFHAPNGVEHVDILKRVIGIPGDTVAIEDDGQVIVNGRPVARCPIGEWKASGGESSDLFLETLDSRSYAVTQSRALVRPRERFGPIHLAADQVYLLGDARDESMDSRHFGPVPIANLMGRLVRVVGGEMGSDPEKAVVPSDRGPALARCAAALK